MLTTATSSKHSSFLEGGGEMGERIRSYDWSATPLGNPDRWPQSLKTCVRIMLTSRQPIWIGWGKELIKLYNDPYRAIVGGKHPWALGQPASVVWKDIWTEIDPLLKVVMEKDEGTYAESQLLIMERNGYPEETYYTFSYTPIPGDKGETEGMICANTDDTERIISERQLRTLKDLGKKLTGMQTVDEVYESALNVLASNSKDFPFAILYKVDNEGRRAHALGYGGIEKEQLVFPATIDLAGPLEGTSDFCEAFMSRTIVVSKNRFRGKALPKGFWEVEANHFIHIPIITSGSSYPNAIISAPLNPYRIYDESYRQFTSLIADQVALEVNNVLTFEVERKRAEALAEIDKAKTIFFSNISHEFRTPLTLMLGPLEELLNRPKSHLNEEERQKVETTHRNAIRLLRLVNNLLDFSRIESGRVRAQFQLTDLAKFTADLASSFRSVIEAAGLKFQVNCQYIVQPVYVDKGMWEKIVLNLLSNAFKYTLDGGVTISLVTKNGTVELKVADTGIGIPEEELPKMFQRFHRMQNATGRTYEGTGIGLSLVSELVKIHGGTISVTSKIDAGSEFTVTIPTGKRHLPFDQLLETETDFDAVLSETFVEEADLLISGTVPGKSNGQVKHPVEAPTVLIVDDNADMREYLSGILALHYHVITACNGQDALHKMKSFVPSLVLTDVMMPIMDGVQLLKAIKEDDKYDKVPVILLTARAGEESRIEGYETGADDYLVKPFSAKELQVRVSSQISARRRGREIEALLRKTIDQLELSINAGGIGIWHWDARKNEMTWSKEQMEIFGMNAGEFNGRAEDFFDHIIPEDRERIHAASRLEFEKSENQYEFRIRRRDGTIRWIQSRSRTFLDADGNPEYITGVNIDFTEQKEVEEKLKFAATLSNSIADAVIGTTKAENDYRITSWNEGAEKVYGWKAEEVIGKPASEVLRTVSLSSEDKEQRGRQVIETGSWREEVIQKHKDGRLLDIHATLSVVKDNTGKEIGIVAVNRDVTEQKKTERAFRHTKEQLELTFKNVPAGIYKMNHKGHLEYVNKRGAELMGYDSPEEMLAIAGMKQLKQHMHDTFLIEDESGNRLVDDAGATHLAFSTGLPATAICHYINKRTGRGCWIFSHSNPFYDEEGKLAFVLTTATDISAQKMAEQKIKLSEENFRELSISLEEQVKQRTQQVTEKNRQLNEAQQVARLGSWEWDIATGALNWSANLCNIYGVDPADPVSYERFISLVHPDDRESVERNIEAYGREGRFLEFYHRIVTPAGTVKTIHSRGEVILGDNGEVIKMIGTGQDVTAEKLISDTLLEAKKNLEQRNAFVEKLLNSSPDQINVFDKELRFITLNDKAEAAIRTYYSGELIGKKLIDVNPGAIDSSSFADLMKAFEGEIIVRDKVASDDGNYFYQHTYVPLLDASGKVYAAMVISHDITENIRQLEELKKLNESDKLRSDFIKMASHELKTPVTSIKGYVQLLLSALLKDEEKPLSPSLMKLSLISIDKQITRLTRLLSELLDLSKIEAGRLEMSREVFSLNEMVIETVQDILYSQSKHQINIFHDFGCNIFGDKDRVGQVLINLLTNAIKYSPTSDKIEVWIRQARNNRVAISVKDYGIGIDNQYHDKIFERFYRVEGKEEQTYPGFGIGLFIAREVVQQHDGLIYFTSEKGKGSVFTFVLPIAQ